LFVDTLLDAYPNATLVMTTRDPEAWMRSMRTSILQILFSGDDAPPQMQAFGEAMVRLWDSDFEKNGREYFLGHNQKVRDEVAKRGRKILEIDVTKAEDFQRLCAWLGKDPPADMVTFPHSDIFKSFKRMHGIGGYEKDDGAADEWKDRITSIKG
jgi:Sulfotransferase domain